MVKDEDGHVFGGFCNEAWACKHNKFYGNGQNFLFSFGETDLPNVYRYTGDGDQFMFSDDKTIALGGSRQKGRFSLCLTDDFKRGSSMKTEIYNNEVLSKKLDFRITALEIWAILD